MKQYLLVLLVALALTGCERDTAGQAEGEQAEPAEVTTGPETVALDETASEEAPTETEMVAMGETGAETMEANTEEESIAGEDDSASGEMRMCSDLGDAATVSVNISNGNPGDAVTGEFICQERGVVASCTATVAGGETTAECTSDSVDASGINQELHCASQVLAGNPEFAVTCSP